MRRRVVVTGLGTINPLGLNTVDTWEGLINGKSGIGLISKFDCTDYPSKIAGEIKGFDPLNHFDKKEAKKR